MAVPAPLPSAGVAWRLFPLHRGGALDSGRLRAALTGYHATLGAPRAISADNGISPSRCDCSSIS